MSGVRNPWLSIPIEDYEGHMAIVGQSVALRDLFGDIYTRTLPRRIAILGCTTGSDLEIIDMAVTESATGVDINQQYLTIAAARSQRLGSRLSLVCEDVLQVELPTARFDLIHCALLLEYVDPTALFPRIHRWLAQGGYCSVVIQEPKFGLPPVSKTNFTSLAALADGMILRSLQEVQSIASEAGLRLVEDRAHSLQSGKTLVSALFAKVGNAAHCG